MRIHSIVRTGVFGLSLGAVIGSVVPAFAETIIYQAQPSPPYTVYQASPPYMAYQQAPRPLYLLSERLALWAREHGRL